MDANAALKALETGIACPKWRSIFKQNLETEKDKLAWRNNMDALWKNTGKFMPDVAIWSEGYGLWPGQVFVRFSGMLVLK